MSAYREGPEPKATEKTESWWAKHRMDILQRVTTAWMLSVAMGAVLMYAPGVYNTKTVCGTLWWMGFAVCWGLAMPKFFSAVAELMHDRAMAFVFTLIMGMLFALFYPLVTLILCAFYVYAARERKRERLEAVMRKGHGVKVVPRSCCVACNTIDCTCGCFER